MPIILTAVLLILAIVLVSYYGAYVTLTGGKHIPLTVRPEQFGFPYEPVEFQTKDGLTLRGWFIPARPENDRTILFCHGWGANKGEVLKNTYALRNHGFNLLYFDFRACGESEGDSLSIGLLEAMDLDAAAAFVKARRPADRLAIYGISMGGMVAFGGLARHPELKAAVIECPFASHDETLSRYARATFGLPYYPFMPLLLYFVRRQLGIDPEPIVSPERLAGRITGAPLLAICGEEDPIATPEISRSLLEKLPGPKELWIVPGAGHAQCAKLAGRAYENKLAAFYARHLSASPPIEV